MTAGMKSLAAAAFFMLAAAQTQNATIVDCGFPSDVKVCVLRRARSRCMQFPTLPFSLPTVRLAGRDLYYHRPFPPRAVLDVLFHFAAGAAGR